MARVTVRFDVREKRGGRTRRLDDQRFEEGSRSRGPLFDVRVAEVLYRSSESTREILHPRRNQRRVESSREEGKGKREEDVGTATRQVSRGRTLIEKKGDTRERERRAEEGKSKGLVGRLRGMVEDSSLATCRGFFFPCGENSLTVRYLSEVPRGTFPGIDYQP